MSDTKTIELEQPIKTPDGGTVTTLELREPTIQETWNAEKKQTGMPGSGRDYQIEFICQVTGLKRLTVLALPVSVVNEAASFLQKHAAINLPVPISET